MAANPAQRTHSLAGASVIVTRPAGSASTLVRAARARGAEVVRLPGMRLAITDDVEGARAALLAARQAQVWIFTSPNAVDYCLELAGPAPLSPTIRVLAVGRGTQAALARHGIAAKAPAGAQNSEGLLQESSLQALQGQWIAIIDAPGGRGLLAPILRERGARVEQIAVYLRLPPQLDTRHFLSLAAAPRPWLSLISSSVALGHLMDALPEDLRTRWRQEAVIVSSPRLAGQAQALGFTDIHEARSALGADLLDGAIQALARHRL